MIGLRSQLGMKRGSTPTPVRSDLRLFSREAITLIDAPLEGAVYERSKHRE
jgi:hypothetical protein